VITYTVPDAVRDAKALAGHYASAAHYPLGRNPWTTLDGVTTWSTRCKCGVSTDRYTHPHDADQALSPHYAEVDAAFRAQLVTVTSGLLIEWARIGDYNHLTPLHVSDEDCAAVELVERRVARYAARFLGYPGFLRVRVNMAALIGTITLNGECAGSFVVRPLGPQAVRAQMAADARRVTA
jgi:hypothetical protein